MVDHPDNPPSLVPAESEDPTTSDVPSALDPKVPQDSHDWMATGNEDITIVHDSPINNSQHLEK